tara:strand:+ start:95 stop:289 length:195 start_codon:yes stop_codon:yes gene_type:complete
MKAGDLVKWTFAKTSSSINRDNNYYIGILIYPESCPKNSWIIMLSDGDEVHGDVTEIEVISETR